MFSFIEFGFRSFLNVVLGDQTNHPDNIKKIDFTFCLFSGIITNYLKRGGSILWKMRTNSNSFGSYHSGG